MSYATSGRRLYHFQLSIPKPYRFPCFQGELTYSGHAKHEARSDRYGHIELPVRLEPKCAKLIEVETVDGVVVKQLWRQPLDATRDIVMAVTNEGMVKTVWVNLRTDKHRSLDASRYEFSHLAGNRRLH
ncbi:hypothetical protein [Paraburkholderia sp. A3RO-2L]|uniref:hypothetical protein n=1 Tax=Paraburkholderia sp. A3RO-2L TaxID=3028376 RepID=UPI003DAA3ACF